MDREIAGDSGESNIQFGGDDTTCNCAGTVAANFVDYVSILFNICTSNCFKLVIKLDLGW